MENTDDKNYIKIVDPTDPPQGKKIGKVTIHTMPKRYMASLPASSNAKSTGILILILGFLFLIFALLFLYFYISKKPSTVQDLPKDPVVDQKSVDKPTDKTPGTDDSKTDDVLVDIDPGDQSQATSSDDKEPLHQIDVTVDISKKYIQATDSDKDGLSDLEELLLGSSPNSQDTDGDSYSDLLEVLNLYDVGSKGTLSDSINIREYRNEEYDFSIYVSSLWEVDSVSGNDSLIVSLGKDQYIQIISEKNVAGQSIDNWYMDSFEVDMIPNKQVIKRGNWNGVAHESGLTVYLEHPSKHYIITLNYELGSDNTLYYKNIFDMMLQSISVING